MKKHYPLLILAILIAEVAAAQFTWTNKNNFPGTNRFWQAAFALNGNGYIVGGKIETGDYINETWEYNPTSDSWTQVANFPYTTIANGYFAIDNIGYVVGGATNGGNYVSGAYKYDPSNPGWTAIASCPAEVGETYSFVVNGIGYIGQGINSAMYAYNPTLNSWTTKATFPGINGINMVGFAIDSFGYVGMGTDGDYDLYNQFYRYNPDSDSWSEIAPFPGIARANPYAFVLNGLAYVGGGWTVGSCDDEYALSDMYQYDPSSDTWTPVPGLPGVPRISGGSFTIGGNAYVAGGYNNASGAYFNAVSEFGPCDQAPTAIAPPPVHNNGAGFEVYPNPSSATIQVKMNSEVNNGLQYSVLSIDGQKINTGVVKQQLFEFSVNGLSDGVYMLQIQDQSGAQTVKRFEVMH